jgi:hypothetical protein
MRRLKNWLIWSSRLFDAIQSNKLRSSLDCMLKLREKKTSRQRMSIISSVEKRSRSIDVVSIVLTRIRKKAKIKHLFVMIHIILLRIFHHLRVIIDCEAIWNFFSQSKLIKIDVLILNEKFSNSRLKILDDTFLMIYFDYVLLIEIIDINESKRISKETFVEIDMYEMNIILSLFWLFHANFLIRFRERTIVHEKIIHLIASEVRNDSTEKRLEIVVVIEKNSLFNNFVVAIIEVQDILDICESKNVNVYFLDLQSLIIFDLSFIIDVAVASESNEISSEYLEFNDVFFWKWSQIIIETWVSWSCY